jgi:hypothetical protein
MARDRASELESRIREARARAEPVYRKLGEHLKACETCRESDSLRGAPTPFCGTGDRLLTELSRARYDLSLAATQLMKLQGPSEPAAANAPRRRMARGVGEALRKQRRPWTTNPRHFSG